MVAIKDLPAAEVMTRQPPKVFDIIEEEDMYYRADGACVRVDYVDEGIVYYVSWAPGQEIGSPKREPMSSLAEKLRREGMMRSA